MQPSEAEEIVGLLRQMRVMAHVHPTGLQKSAIRVVLPGAEKRFGTRTQLLDSRHRCWLTECSWDLFHSSLVLRTSTPARVPT